jgi:hypothetical protein
MTGIVVTQMEVECKYNRRKWKRLCYISKPSGNINS